MNPEPSQDKSLTISVCFFARLRETLGTERLTLTIPAGSQVNAVLASLASRGGPWAELTSGQPVMIAVNQTMARGSTPLEDRDEVALFPPVTGG
ncbi:MAG: molybdopterin converting factor subunit 1 [Marinobacter sp.]|nr:molybdopterin converting factor subunit 1 [Marinobacter sp.]